MVHSADIETIFSIDESTLDRADTADAEVQDVGQLYVNLNTPKDFGRPFLSGM
jgi:hypothetical protein